MTAYTNEYHPNVLSEFVYKRTYARWREDLGRREVWPETVARLVNFFREERSVIPHYLLKEIEAGILAMEVLPSMRALWSAGDAARRDNTCLYNCAAIPLDSVVSYGELLYVLMQGTGAGFSVRKTHVGNFPEVPSTLREVKLSSFVVPDTAEGWADSVKHQLTALYHGVVPTFDYSEVRPQGAVLKTKGGRASGPQPLQDLHDHIEATFFKARGRKLTTLEHHDIGCAIGEAVISGGVRRSAENSISDPDDELLRHAKNWKRGSYPKIRSNANNSAYWSERPSREVFDTEWAALRESGSGERGFFMLPEKVRTLRGTDKLLPNPCFEALLRHELSQDWRTGKGGGASFCNLSAVVIRPEDTRETIAKKVRLATIIGCIQASFTKFPYLRPAWTRITEDDALLGVDLTGQCDNPQVMTWDNMRYWNKVAQKAARKMTAILGTNFPAAIFVGKPSGNSSNVVHCAPGFHVRHAPFYIRRVQIAGTDPLLALALDEGAPCYKLPWHEDKSDTAATWYVEFPVKSPEGCITRHDETALEQLARYLDIMQSWCDEYGHNQSATIYVRDHEWDEVGDWVFEHFDEITGLSFLPYDGGKYEAAPYEEITEEEYERRLAAFPQIDFSNLSSYESEDFGSGSRELACVGGACAI